MVAGFIGFFDPGLVVLGGGVGQNPLMLDEVRHVARELTWATDIAVSSLGANGTVFGATRLAADYALAEILGETPNATIVLTPEAASDESQPSFG
jgi:hypothetical protein